ncbi:hypothetical protein MMC26_003865 [Xylographa opegraphella]|nr:hypothetical protein [Xylographa opegraphella]
MALQRYHTIYLFYILVLFFHLHEFTQALAHPVSANVHLKSSVTAHTSPPHGATGVPAIISNCSATSSTKLLPRRNLSPPEQRNLSVSLGIPDHHSKFARSLTATSVVKVEFVSTPGSATRTQRANRSSATTVLTCPQILYTPNPTTLHTVSTRSSITTASTNPSNSTSTSASIKSTSATAPPPYTSASQLATALLPQNLSLSLLVPLILVLAIIIILLFLLIRSSRPTITPVHQQPPFENRYDSRLLEVPSTESTVVTCREIHELPDSSPWSDWERCLERIKELDAGV